MQRIGFVCNGTQTGKYLNSTLFTNVAFDEPGWQGGASQVIE